MKNKFRKKPIVIEAMQINEQSEYDIKIWSHGKVYSSPVLEPTETNVRGCYWQIDTLEGVMVAIPNDWIIKGVNGEFYPCKPDIFEKNLRKSIRLINKPKNND